ncbi:hypothetical protein GCM10010472_04160 [Pseudonocardia halophobica]
MKPRRDRLRPAGTPEGTPLRPADLQKGQKGQQGHLEVARDRKTAWTGAELVAAVFKPPRFAVPGIIAEGVSVLAGAPKIGKSWLSLHLAVAVALGGKALGRIDVVAGDVLYLALEDTGRRLQNRLRKVLGDEPITGDLSRLTLETTCPPFPAGAAYIRAWLDERPDARMVIIDVFAKMRGNPPPGVSAYDADYSAVGFAKRIADDYGIAVVLVHHVRKMGSEDFLAEVSGTNGLAGASDAVVVLRRSRGSADGSLHVTGRDVDETEYALTFDPDRGLWEALDGPALDHLVGETRAVILDWVRANPGGGPKQIAEGTGLGYELIKKTVARMADDGQLVKADRGRYSVTPTAVPAVPTVPSAGQGVIEGVPAGVPIDEAVPDDPLGMAS